jgi:hypothetical protein
MTSGNGDAVESRVRFMGIDELLFDPQNPRLEDEDRGVSQEQLAALLDELYDAREVGSSIANFGYFESEVLVGVPAPQGKVTIVEGNRRLAAVKGLARPAVRAGYTSPKEWDRLAHLAAEKGHVPERVPVLVEPDRSAVIATIGYRHISGIKQWEPYQQARYVAERIDHDGLSLKEVGGLTGITETQVRSKYRNFGIVRAAEAAGADPALIQESFGVWDNALGRVPLRQFIGAPDPAAVRPKEPVISPEKYENLREMVGWIFGPGTAKKIRESRDLGTLADVVANPVGLEALRGGLTLLEAVQAMRQPKTARDRLIQFLTTAASALKSAGGVVGDAAAGGGDDLAEDAQVRQLLVEIDRALEPFPARDR